VHSNIKSLGMFKITQGSQPILVPTESV